MYSWFLNLKSLPQGFCVVEGFKTRQRCRRLILLPRFRFEGHMECPPGISHPSFSVNHSILEAVRPRLRDFHQLLLDPPKVSPGGDRAKGERRGGKKRLLRSCLAEERHKDHVGGAGPPRGEHQAQCGQTGCQLAAEQHTQHQLGTH